MSEQLMDRLLYITDWQKLRDEKKEQERKRIRDEANLRMRQLDLLKHEVLKAKGVLK